MCPSFPGCDAVLSSGDDSDSNDDDSNSGDDDANPPKLSNRWISPITTLPTNFGTACSLETCDMCPTFPGCGSGEMKAGREDLATPPPAAASAVASAEKRADAPSEQKKAPKPGNWEQPPGSHTMRTRREKREANISPIVVSGGWEGGVGPECSVMTCDLCPEHPGCEDGGQTWDQGEGEGDDGQGGK